MAITTQEKTIVPIRSKFLMSYILLWHKSVSDFLQSIKFDVNQPTLLANLLSMSEQRRRIKTEDQTIWIIGWIAHQDDLNEKDEFILIFKIVLSLGIGWFAHQDDLKEKDECILFLKIVLGKKLARQGIE